MRPISLGPLQGGRDEPTPEALDAATPKIMPILGAMKENFAAPPELMTTKVEWTYGSV